ncbi:MAG: glycosyltransferase family 9 protein [Proteobacteria bacterium]|nr:glycosyltransferase family 9 protein [Pseudomonadota bacterium]
MHDDYASILVIATRQIGDVLLTTPLIRAARRRWPAARIDVLGLPGTLGMLRGNPDITACIEAPRGGGWRRQFGFLRRMWRRYDLALVTQQSDRAHLYGAIAARVRAGLLPERDGTSWWKRRLLIHAVTTAGDRGDVHTADEKLALLDPWRGADAAPVDVVAPSPAPLPDDLERQLAPRFVVVQVPSMWRYKQWPVEHFRSVVDRLARDGLQVVLTGGAAQGDRAKVAEVRPSGDATSVIDMAGRLDLNQLAALLQRAALYIGPDTSVTHLAAALRVPMVVAFGPTNPVRWGPLPGGVPGAAAYARRAAEPQRAGRIVLLQGPDRPTTPGCVPCGRAGCDDHRDSRSLCLEGIAPERVIAEARRLLGTDHREDRAAR